MALRASLRRLGYGPGLPRDCLAPHVYVDNSKTNDVIRQFQFIKRMAKQNGTLKRVFQLQRRELPSDRRRYNMMDRNYFKRWHFMKYCTQMINFGIRRGLRFRSDADSDHTNVPRTPFEGLPYPTAGSARLTRAQFADIEGVNARVLEAWRHQTRASEDGRVDPDPALSLDELRRKVPQWSPSSRPE
eukprot:TRINITY_DN24994_c0_g1_i1.p2 TRINITY_DN24994_c0_g1~~TRINITY_DN24994_c0_g1_i1.p2  ORF type:complete len:187 (-),score=30.17 TRINITY_DN24994_c0_g1_i1:80-640(-)